MPNFTLSQQPHFPIVTIETDTLITAAQLNATFRDQEGVTLCVRSSIGHPRRGGYFFCVLKESETRYRLETVEGIYVESFELDTLIRFINHVSGRQFDESMLIFCQNSVNFRED